MGGFSVIHGSPMTIWCPVDSNAGSPDTLYVGQIVKSSSDGVVPLAAASGAGDTTGKAVPFGVIVGTNNRSPLYNSTYKTEYITGADTQALQLARDWTGQEGVWSKGDPQAMVQVALIDPCTILKGRIFNAAYGTAPTVVTSTAAGTDGWMTAGTTGACDFTPVADLATAYCRSGANMGLLRITIDSSTTAPTVDTAYPYDVAIGDTFVRVPVRPIGKTYMQTDSESTYVEASASPATDYWIVDVIKLDLRTSGDEHVLFRFSTVHFDPVRT